MKTKIKVSGMHCKSCEILISDSLQEKQGVQRVISSAASGEVDVEFDDSKISLDKIKQVIRKEGYKVA
jgi:copper chaperone